MHDLTLGTAGVLLGALWARRAGVAGSRELAEHAAAVLLAEAQPTPDGLNWSWVPERFRIGGPPYEMPNLSHGLAGIAAALAVAGSELERPDLVAAARLGAEHLVGLADRTRRRFRRPAQPAAHQPRPRPGHVHLVPRPDRHVAALRRAGPRGRADVAGAAPDDWYRRCLHSVRTSGLPERLHPGFWDNDGQCCGTAGVGEVFLRLLAALGPSPVTWSSRSTSPTCWSSGPCGRARTPTGGSWSTGPRSRCCRPGVGWMQGAAGIAAFLFRAARVAEDPSGAAVLARMDTWWALPGPP